MLKAHGVFAFSPELGIKNFASNSFYPRQEIQKKIITEDYKVVQSFLKFHIPRFTVKNEISSLNPKSYYIQLVDGNKQKLTRSVLSTKRIGMKNYQLTLLQHSVSNLDDIKLVFIHKGNPVKNVKFANSKELPHQKPKTIKINHFKNGFITEKMSIKRRSYLAFEFSSKLGPENEFVVLVEKENKLIGKFVHVLVPKTAIDLLMKRALIV